MASVFFKWATFPRDGRIHTFCDGRTHLISLHKSITKLASIASIVFTRITGTQKNNDGLQCPLEQSKKNVEVSLVLGCPVVIRTNISPFKVRTRPRFQAEASSAAKMSFLQFRSCVRGFHVYKVVSSTVSDILRCQRVESREFLRVLSLYRADVRGMLFFVLIRSGRLHFLLFLNIE